MIVALALIASEALHILLARTLESLALISSIRTALEGVVRACRVAIAGCTQTNTHTRSITTCL